MPSEKNYGPTPASQPSAVQEQDIEADFIRKLRDLKYTHRSDISDRASLEKNFRQKFEFDSVFTKIKSKYNFVLHA